MEKKRAQILESANHDGKAVEGPMLQKGADFGLSQWILPFRTG
jgi:hypothetical protein